jgi:serine/threonine-protein kinase
MARTAEAVAPGSLVLGRYRPIRPLGSGGSGSVWLAQEEASGREVALKIVPREGNAGARAEREAGAAARLRSERCLRARALARDPGHVYIVYDYVPGKTLREAMRAGEVSDPVALEAAAQILEGLASAHEKGIVHRDLKPANVLLEDTEDVRVKVFDFGLAVMHEEETLTAVGDIPGTLAYISPERLRGEPAKPAADVWAVGVLLWEMLACKHPFWGGSLLDTARRIEQGAPSLATERPDLDRRIVECVYRALSVDPARRPSASALAAQLRKVTSEPRRRNRTPAPAVADPPDPPAAAAVLFSAWCAAATPFFRRAGPSRSACRRRPRAPQPAAGPRLLPGRARAPARQPRARAGALRGRRHHQFALAWRDPGRPLPCGRPRAGVGRPARGSPVAGMAIETRSARANRRSVFASVAVSAVAPRPPRDRRLDRPGEAVAALARAIERVTIVQAMTSRSSPSRCRSSAVAVPGPPRSPPS